MTVFPVACRSVWREARLHDMDLMEAMKERHSVRRYLDRPVEGDVRERLLSFISDASEESGLRISLVLDEPSAFDTMMAHYGKFSGVRNYIAIAGRKGLDEAVGYYGERLVLLSQTLGLNTCWVALTYSRRSVPLSLARGEKLYLVIAVGYGAEKGRPHRSKPASAVSRASSPAPLWFISGVKAALDAPTAINQQKFVFTLLGSGCVRAEAGRGPYSRIDLGIAKYHFELGAGRDNFTWK